MKYAPLATSTALLAVMMLLLLLPGPAHAQECFDFSALDPDAKADCNRESIQLLSAFSNGNRQRVHSLEGDMDTAYGGIAGAYAAANHHFQVGRHAGLQGSIAVAHFEGNDAFSMALGLPVNRTFIAFQGAVGSGNADAVSASISWGF